MMQAGNRPLQGRTQSMAPTLFGEFIDFISWCIKKDGPPHNTDIGRIQPVWGLVGSLTLLPLGQPASAALRGSVFLDAPPQRVNDGVPDDGKFHSPEESVTTLQGGGVYGNSGLPGSGLSLELFQLTIKRPKPKATLLDATLSQLVVGTNGTFTGDLTLTRITPGIYS